MRITNTNNLIGYNGESYSREITYEIEESLQDCDIYFEFEKPSKDKYVSEKIDNLGMYYIPSSLLDEIGFLKIQMVAYRGSNFIIKSAIKDFYIANSINAVDALIYDEGNRNILKKLDTIKLDGEGNKYLADNGEYKEVSGGSVPKIVSWDVENPIILRDLESNSYVLQGYILPFVGSTELFVMGAPLIVGVCRFDDMSYVQLFFPVNNTLQYFEIQNDSYIMKQLSFNDLITLLGQ